MHSQAAHCPHPHVPDAPEVRFCCYCGAPLVALEPEFSALSENPQLFERLASLSPDPMYVVDVLQHRFLYINETTVKLLGVSREQLMQPNGSYLLLQRVHPEDVEKTRLRYRKLYQPLPPDQILSEEPPFDGLEYRIRDAEGNWRWFHSRESVFARLPTGEVSQIIGVAHDIDDHKRAVQALLNNREKLRQFLEHTPAPIAVLDRDCRYIAVSRRWITDYRLPHESLVGKSHFEVFSEIPDDWRDVLERSFRGAVERNEAARFVRSDGSVQWLRWEVRPWYTALHEIGGVIIFSEDITDRILVEEENRRHAEELRYAQRLAHVGSWSWEGSSLKTGYRFSEEILRIYGINPGQQIPFFNAQKGKFYSEENWEIIRQATEKTLTTGATSEVEIEAFRMDGTPIWINARIEAARNEQGQISGLRGTVQEITERKRTESAIRTSEIRLAESRHAEELLLASRNKQQAIFDSLFGFIGLFTLDGEFVEVNREPLLVGGLKREDVIGRKLSDVIWFPELRRARRLLRDALRRAARGEVVRFETPVLLQDASTIVVDAMFGPLRDDSGTVVNIIGFAVDVTRRKEAEQALQQSQAWLTLALQAAHMGTWRYDLQSGLFTGDSISKAMHCVEDQERFDNFETGSRFIHPDDLPEIRRRFDQALRESGSYAVEYRVLTPEGNLRWIACYGKVDPERQCLIAINQDITDRKRADEQMASLRDELAHVARLGTMGEMASGLAHELNQPLAALQVYSHSALVLARQTRQPDLPNLLNKIGEQSLRAGEIIRRMRNFVRRGTHHPVQADLARLIQDVLLMLETYLRHNSVQLDHQFPAQLFNLTLDVIQIQQVLVNLIRNAVEAMSDSPSKNLCIRVTADSEAVLIRIADTGPGIPEAVAGRLFEPFQTTKPHGMGLGLAISRTLVEAHGGRIFVEPNPEGGSVFCFTLPAPRS